MVNKRLLVPVSRSSTVRETVAYAVDDALSDGRGYVRFVYVHSPEVAAGDETEPVGTEPAEELLSRAEIWAAEDAGDRADDLTVETAHLGTDRYVFSPVDIADVLTADAEASDVDRIVLDPEYAPDVGLPILRPLKRELEASPFDVTEATVLRPTRRGPLLRGTTVLRVATLFGISFLFYLVLGGAFDAFDLLTGAVSATIVAVALSRVSLTRDPDWQSPLRVLRMVVYVPYLFWEIFKSNVQIAAVILDPRMPIDPRLVRVKPAVWGALPMTTLANSITLTPGTLTVRIEGRELLIHTLVPDARSGLFAGSLERAVRFVFYGRHAMRIPGIEERGDAELIDGDVAADTAEFKSDDSDDELSDSPDDELSDSPGDGGENA